MRLATTASSLARLRRNLMTPGMGRWRTSFEAGEGDEEVVEAHDGVDFVAHGEDVGGDFGVEEGAGDDVEGQLHHLVVDVDGLVGGPSGRRIPAALETIWLA